MGTMSCPNCGSAIAINAAYCPKCGVPINVRTVPCRTCSTPLAVERHRSTYVTSEITGASHYEVNGVVNSTVNRSFKHHVDFSPCPNCGESRPILAYEDSFVGGLYRGALQLYTLFVAAILIIAAFNQSTFNLINVIKNDRTLSLSVWIAIGCWMAVYVLNKLYNQPRIWWIANILAILIIYVAGIIIL
jgi:predicted RNA-binding Zn-ribbon protein involved in translation (DUF1610 family)